MSNDVAFAPLTVPVLAETETQHAVADAARARGFAAGYADGRRQAAEEQAGWLADAEAVRAAEAAEAADRVAVLTRALQGATVELREATVPVLADVEGALVAAAFELAEAVVGTVLADRLAAARAAVGRVFAEAPAGEVAAIRLNPGDLALLATTHGALGGVTTVPDPSLAPGDAIAELPAGWLDARIRSALDRAKEALR
ncbi:FliH/SctL family protein [Leifsonia shinshuensis]|uniref:Flagellar assembly protein FliH n=2 Tax=Leifsonia shinshuensis TaxID=150026 RepID=A0A853CNT6_9MICO|nr:FliH/SctL family protein [Leifsonia shinshuensis]NYJ22112.1 flagellar assembly protein FliH [Leifsonia shinshuensis]